nr:AsmA family protein [Desulfobulbaceae bacterium]
MGKLGKFLAGALALGLIVVGGLTVFVKMYLTDEKVRELVVPQAEKALGRKVAIGNISVGLLSGISIADFSVAEADGKNEFLSVEEFIIAYKLFPLLQKEVVVSEIKLVKPSVTVLRDKMGQFNFQNLKILAGKAEEKAEIPTEAKAVALPVALTVDSIKIVQANLKVRDEKGELPDIDVVADMSVAVKLANSLASLMYNGQLAMTVDAKYGDISPNVKVEAVFDPSVLTYTANALVGEERLKVTGTVRDYLDKPHVILSIVSEQLNLDYLAALGAALPQAEKNGQKKNAKPKAKAATKGAIADSLPPGLSVDGTVSVANSMYKKLAIKDFFLKFALKDGLLTVNDLKAKTAGGSVDSSMKVDLTKPDLVYDGKLTAQALNVTTVGNGLGQEFAKMVSGTLASSISFAGSGMDADTIKKALTANVEYSLLNGQISNTQITDSIASLLKVPELKTIAFSDFSGALELLKGGTVQINTGLKGNDLSASTKGTFDLDGNLNLPVNVTLPKELMAKIDSGGQLGKLLAAEDGSFNLTLNVLGNYLNPKVSLDQSSVNEKVQKAVTNKVMQEVERSLLKNSADGESQVPPEVETQVKGLLKGLFGK